MNDIEQLARSVSQLVGSMQTSARLGGDPQEDGCGDIHALGAARTPQMRERWPVDVLHRYEKDAGFFA